MSSSELTAAPAADTTGVDMNHDNDSALGNTDTESTMTLPSYVLNYQCENGRTYHAFHEGKYLLPNDDREQDRLDMVHHIYSKVAGGKLFLAPIQNPQKVLDIGTGTGIWAIEFADVIGTDLSAIQPTWVPPNVKFMVDDAEADWTFKYKFDFIHVRNLGAGISDMGKLLKWCYRHLKPGGWVELQDGEARPSTDDCSLTPNHALWKWVDHLEEASMKAMKKLSIAETQMDLIKDAGFINIQEEVYKTPLGTWPKGKELKAIGQFTKEVLLEGLESYSLALFTRVLKWELAQVHLLLRDV
ncbi:MAG: hypothetical protein M1840_000842 [Geoglossum simile]|nr:MAG: hypothetical protein M1840_000842 [Geoglossum simile]